MLLLRESAEIALSLVPLPDRPLTGFKCHKRGISSDKLLVTMFDTDSSSDPHGRARSPTLVILDAVCAQLHK